MAIVYLGIGSNLGDRKKNIEKALQLLSANDITILKLSTIIETEPVGVPPAQEKYLNGALKAETDLPPEQLLICLKRIECALGRTASAANSPRPIDLDILLYNQLRLQTPELTIPHPRMYQRDFVMRPLKEIEPDFTRDLEHAHR